MSRFEGGEHGIEAKAGIGPDPHPGTTKLHRLEEYLAAAKVELLPAELAEIAAALSQISVQAKDIQPN